MSARDPWLEYRLRRIEFRNGAEIGFRRARMLYNEDDHIIAIEHIDASSQKIDDTLKEIANPYGDLPEIKTLYYDMVVTIDGRKPVTLGFYHPMKRGAQVNLMPPEPGRSRLFFSQADGKPMFTKEWTLRDVSDGEIDSDKAVWQFHGYKHER